MGNYLEGCAIRGRRALFGSKDGPRRTSDTPQNPEAARSRLRGLRTRSVAARWSFGSRTTGRADVCAASGGVRHRHQRWTCVGTVGKRGAERLIPCRDNYSVGWLLRQPHRHRRRRLANKLWQHLALGRGCGRAVINAGFRDLRISSLPSADRFAADLVASKIPIDGPSQPRPIRP